MTIWQDALATLYADQHMAEPATYKAQGAGAGVTVRVVHTRPDLMLDYGDTRVVAGSTMINVLRTAVAAPAKDDTFTLGPDVYRVVADPAATDPKGLEWKCEVRPVSC